MGDLLLISDGGRPFRPFVRIPIAKINAFASRIRLVSRLRRQSVNHINCFKDRLVVIAFNHIWCLNSTDGELMGPPARVEGSRPLALCVTPHGLYYGEYRNNAERRAIRLFHSEDGVKWEEVRRFDGIRHIHGVYYDQYANKTWVTTGDLDDESGIWCSSDGFDTVERVVSGSQRARAIPLLFSERYVFFGTDAPDEVNNICRLDRRSGIVERLAEVDGPVFHAAQAGEHMLFSTAVEPSRVNLSRDAVLYRSKDGERWTPVARRTKDRWHMKLFQYGQLMLPSGINGTRRIWYSTFAVENDHCIFSTSE